MEQRGFYFYTRVNSLSRESSMETEKSSSSSNCTTSRTQNPEKACSKWLGCGLGVHHWRSSYLCAVGWLYAACLGPWAGWLAACNSLDTIKFEVITIMTFILFLLSLVLTAKPGYRVVAWLWLLAGIIWLIVSWLKYCFREFGEDLEKWRDICLVESVLWTVTALLPTLLTDPAVLWLFSRAF